MFFNVTFNSNSFLYNLKANKVITSNLRSVIKTLYILFFISLSACNSELGKWDIGYYEQKIEGTSKAIYKYDAWGGRDTHVYGYAILDTTEVFSISDINQLPIYRLNGIPNSKVINAIKRNWPEEENIKLTLEPIDSFKIIDSEIRIAVKKYQSAALYQQGRGGVNTFEFSNSVETRDSISFYNLDDRESIYHLHLDTLTVLKGNILISQNENKEIRQILVEDLSISDDGKHTLLSCRTYFLKPKNRTTSDEFSDYGIFKQKPDLHNKD